MQSFDFDAVHSRIGTGSIKYEQNTKTSTQGIIPMWIADMDFKIPPAVENALISSADHGIFGYTMTDTEYDDLITAWYKKRMSWQIRPGWILKAPGVMFAIAASIQALTNPGDAVLICQPVYYPFAKIVSANNRKLIVSELKLNNGKYEIDFADLEEKIATNSVKIFLLCSPHNPVGRVWSKDELILIGQICTKHDVIIISDEIHSDFIFDGQHTPIASLSEEIADRTITCTSPTKAFNLAGLQAANIIISNERLLRKVRKASLATGYSNLNTMAIAATKAAYRDGEEWLDELLSYLKGNYDVLKDAFPENGEISLIHPEGTYLAWLDCRKLGLTDSELDDFFINKAGVQLHLGSIFGTGGNGFVRMNIACPRSILFEAVTRIKNAIQNGGR